MPRQLVNREELGKLLAQTSGAITTIVTHIVVLNRHLVTTIIPSLHQNQDGFVRVQIMRATMPSASMYMQLNFIVVRAEHFNVLNQAVR
jgi:hypothetical protein